MMFKYFYLHRSSTELLNFGSIKCVCVCARVSVYTFCFPTGSHRLNNYSLYSDCCSLLIQIFLSPLFLFHIPSLSLSLILFLLSFTLSSSFFLLCSCRSPLMLLCPQYRLLLRKQLRKVNWRYCSLVLLCAVQITDVGAVLVLCILAASHFACFPS